MPDKPAHRQERKTVMSPRERVLLAMRHEEPDRVPLFYRDIPEVRERLLRELGFSDSEALFQFLGIDFRWVAPAYIGPPLTDAARPAWRRNIWGAEFSYDRFGDGAGYWNVRHPPLEAVEDPGELDRYPWPKLEWFDFSVLSEECDRYEGYALMTAPGFASPGVLQCPVQELIGVERSLTDPLVNPEFFAALLRKVVAFNRALCEAMMEAGHGRIDFFRQGDDFGTQRALLMSPDLWREKIGPALREIAEPAKRADAYYYHHSCGAIRALIPDLLAIGVDAIDPVQVLAEGMAPAELKAEFGGRVVFSGGVDEQELLPNGTPEDVRAGVWKLLDEMAVGGGFFVGPTHNFQVDIPTPNILALYEAARDWIREG
jgi:uroporphyrinogen decarboxylase